MAFAGPHARRYTAIGEGGELSRRKPNAGAQGERLAPGQKVWNAFVSGLVANADLSGTPTALPGAPGRQHGEKPASDIVQQWAALTGICVERVNDGARRGEKYLRRGQRRGANPGLFVTQGGHPCSRQTLMPPDFGIVKIGAPPTDGAGVDALAVSAVGTVIGLDLQQPGAVLDIEPAPPAFMRALRRAASIVRDTMAWVSGKL